MKICICVDPMSSSIFDYDVDKEYEEIKKEFVERFHGIELEFETQVMPHHLDNKPLDVYVFDYGGMMPGCEDLIKSLFREFIKQAEDHPNTAFVLFSNFSERWYKEMIEADFSQYVENKQHNVIFKVSLDREDDDVFVERVKLITGV